MRLPDLHSRDSEPRTSPAEPGGGLRRAPGGRPVYHRIADHIREEIDAGELSAGQRLPPIRQLARDLAVNRDTVALAYEALATEGLVEATVGRGTFVREAATPRVPRHAFEAELAEPVERLLAFENARPRFGAQHDVVALHSLVPDPAFYPVAAFRRSLNRVLTERGPELFGYAGPQGHPHLREVIGQRLRRAGVGLGDENVVLCHGASQGISLALRLFASAGDAVAVESPSYHNVLATLIALGIDARPVTMNDDGPDLAHLDRVLADPDVKAFYTIPTFHNPMGLTTRIAHRRELLRVAARRGKPIIEDAFEMDLRYVGRSVSPLAAADERGQVVQLGSFSKSLFPGVRVGWLAARGRALDGLVALKHATDLSDSMPLQAALADFVETGAYDRHLGRMRRVLKGRREALLTALESEMPAGARWTKPEGGYQVWLDLGFDIDTRDLLADTARAGVLFAPGSQFFWDGGPSRCLRLTLAQVDEDEIFRGVAALGRAVRERQKDDRTALAGGRVNM